MSFAIEGKWEGLEEVFRRLESLPRKIRGKVLRPAIRKTARPVLKAIKAKCSTRTKTLKKSLGMKVKTYRKSGTVTAIIGPRKGFKTQIGTYSRGPNKGKPIFEDPTNIAHLVEFGHGGPHPAPAQSFMRAGWDENKGTAEGRLRAEILEGIEKYA